jgi:twitching motility protein PilJ
MDSESTSTAGAILSQGPMAPAPGRRLVRPVAAIGLLFFAISGLFVWLTLRELGSEARQISVIGDVLMHTQRLAKAAPIALAGAPDAIDELVESRDAVDRDFQLLVKGSDNPYAAPTAPAIAPFLHTLQDRWQSTLGAANTIARVRGALVDTNAVGAQPVADARDAQIIILGEAEPLRLQSVDLERRYVAQQSGHWPQYAIIAGFALLALGSAGVIAVSLLRESRRRTAEAEAARLDAQQKEEAAQKRNDQNQAAILRLMNELQEVADGNLVVQATVTEDITGAIADSVNYTLEELRALVGRINQTAELVSNASGQSRDIATRLLGASASQSREIRETGQRMLLLIEQIGDVSAGAAESDRVAHSSLEAAERGQRAVYNQISGMNEIREQIQETSRRIKRLGESSQEIGEIVELISDITEQTNVLALNAAIQAASAGDAGRGFAVVAEEVQRLADRSGEAARQISTLVRAIQGDTQDAVIAMERSTQGVVEGTRLSDAAGAALSEIGRITRQLTDLIERIAASTASQASAAGTMAQSIERILSVTEQTSDGTREAAQSIGQLATLARELKASVARFRVV